MDATADSEAGLVDGLVQLSFEVQSILARVGATHDLSLTQIRLLGIVRDRKIGTLELARLLRLDKSSVSGLVDRAERRDLVRRSPSPVDGRSILVTPTARGRRLIAVAERSVAAGITDLTAHLSSRQRAALTAMLGTLLAPLQRQD